MPDHKGFLGISNLPRIFRCPECGKTVDENNTICPHCSADLNTTPAATQPAIQPNLPPGTPSPLDANQPNPALEHMFRVRTDDGAPLNEAAEMDRYSSNAMWFGICSICCWGFITGPIAVYFAIRALILVQRFPNFERNDNCTIKAIVGLIFGGLFTLVSAFWILARIMALTHNHWNR